MANLEAKLKTEKKQTALLPPKAAVPKFSGNHADWREFRNIFTSLTENILDLDRLRVLN